MISNTLNHKQLLKLTRGAPTQYTSESGEENNQIINQNMRREAPQQSQKMRDSGNDKEFSHKFIQKTNKNSISNKDQNTYQVQQQFIPENSSHPNIRQDDKYLQNREVLVKGKERANQNTFKVNQLQEDIMEKKIKGQAQQQNFRQNRQNQEVIQRNMNSAKSKNNHASSAYLESNFQTFGEHDQDQFDIRTPQKQGDSNYKSNIRDQGVEFRNYQVNQFQNQNNSLLQLDAEKYEQFVQEQNMAFERQYPQRVQQNNNHQHYQKVQGDLQLDSEEYDPKALKRKRKQRSDQLEELQEEGKGLRNRNANQIFQKNSHDESDGQLERNIDESNYKAESPKYIIIERELESQSSTAHQKMPKANHVQPFTINSQNQRQVEYEYNKTNLYQNAQAKQRGERNREQEYDYNDQYIKYIQQQKDLELEYQWRQRMVEQKRPKRRETQTQRDERRRNYHNQSENTSKPGDESEDTMEVVNQKRKQVGNDPRIFEREKFSNFAADFQSQKSKRTHREGGALPTSRFEEQFIKTQRDPRQMKSKHRVDESSESDEDKNEEEWVVKATKEGFLYFHIPGTKTFQWNFPRYYDYKSRKTKPYFISNWVKKYDHKGRKYWQNSQTKHIQSVKPDQETYLIQASILGNLAFLECYLKAQGNLGIVDQQRRTALHHAVGNGHKEFTAILCNFGKKAKLIDSQDLTGATPLFMAVRYNEVECLKILISFDCNIFHKMRNGDNCLHVAAAYNSLDSMIVVANFGGFELFMERNNQGRRPIDVAERMRNSDTFQTLQKLERNLMYQNAILEREIKSVNKTLKGKRGQKSGRDQVRSGMGLEMGYSKRGREEGYQTTGRHEARSRSKHANKLRLDMISEEDHSSESQEYNHHSKRNRNKSSRRHRLSSEEESSDSEAELTNLGGYKSYQRKVQRKQQELKADDHKKSYLNEIKKRKLEQRRDKRGGHKYDTDVPLFSEYDAKKKTFRRNLDESESEQSFQQDYNSFRQKRKQQLSTRGNINPDSFKEERDLDRTKNFFHLSIRDDSMMADPKLKKLQTARDMFLLNGKNARIDEEEDEEDDEEKNAMRSSKRSKSRPKSARETTQSRERRSALESAISKTSTFMKTLGGFFKGGIEKIKDYVFQEQDNRDPTIMERIRQKNARSQSRGRSKTSRHQKDSDLSDSSQYATPRGKSQTVRIAPAQRISSSSSQDDYRSTNERAIQKERSQKREKSKSQHRKFGRGEVVPQQVVDEVMAGQGYDSRDEEEKVQHRNIQQQHQQYIQESGLIANYQNSSRKNRRVQPLKEDVMQQQSLDRSKSYGRLSKQNNTSSGSNNTGPHHQAQGDQSQLAQNQNIYTHTLNPFLAQDAYQVPQKWSDQQQQSHNNQENNQDQEQLYLTRKRQKQRVIEEEKVEESLETSKFTSQLQTERPSRIKRLKKKRREDNKIDQPVITEKKQASRASQVSLKSIGIGSTNVNETINTHTNSTGSNKLQHSRMIQREKKKRLGNQSKMLIQKNYQSSEDERRKPKLAQRSPSPAPKFMKEEIAYYKYQQEMEKNASQMQGAFQQVQVKNVQNTPTNEVLNVNRDQDSQPIQNQHVPENKHFNLFSPASRQHSQQNSAKSVAQVAVGNQRYQRNQSTSLSGTEQVNQHDLILKSSSANIPLRTQTQQLTSDKQDFQRKDSLTQSQRGLEAINRQSFKAPNLLTQEQFDMIMLNSESESKPTQKESKVAMPQNNQYKIIDSDLDRREETKNLKQQIASDQSKKLLQEPPLKQEGKAISKGWSPEDIKKFYSQLVKDEATLTKIEELINDNGSQTIDESNLSLLYQKVMNKNKSQNQSQPSIIEERKVQQQERAYIEVEFKPDEENQIELEEDQMIFNWEESVDQRSRDEMENLMKDLMLYDEISIHTVTDEENPPASRYNSGLFNLNNLDRGQFVGNSLLSAQGGRQQQNQSSSISKPLFFMGGLPNNSMQQKPTFMNPYQSDAESDYANKKRGKLGKLNGLQIFQHSPALAKVKSKLIPPLLQKSTQSSFNPLIHPGMESERGLKEQSLQVLGSFTGVAPISAMRRLSFQSSDADQSAKPSSFVTQDLPRLQTRSGEICEVVPVHFKTQDHPVEEVKEVQVPNLKDQSNLDSLSTIILNQNSNNTKDQKQMIELFLQDDEFTEKINPSPPIRQQNNFLSAEEENVNDQMNELNAATKAQNFILMDEDDDNLVQLIDDSKVARAVNRNKANTIEDMLDREDSETKRKFYEKLHQQFDIIDQKNEPIIQQDDSPKIFLKRDQLAQQSSSNSSKGLSQENDSKVFNRQMSSRGVALKKNTRYESEESLINMDLTHSKLDQTLKDNQYNDIQIRDEVSKSPKIDSRQSLKTQVKQQIQQYVKQSVHQNQQTIADHESVTLPLQKLQAAYKREEIQNWSSEYHSLLTPQELQRALLGQMMVSAFASTTSNLKLVKRHFLPYHGAANNTTKSLHVDQAATASENKQKVKSQVKDASHGISSLNNSKKEVQVLRQSVSSMQSMSRQKAEISQDSIVQELDSISRIYDDLETVQEEEAGHTYEKTNTLEESKISQTKSHKRTLIPKQQNRYNNLGADDDELEFDQDSQILMNPQKVEPQIKDLFYKQSNQEEHKRDTNPQRSQFNNFMGSDVEDQAETLAPNQYIEKQNRSTANAFLHNYLYTSSEDESKRKTSNILANARPRLKNKNLLHSSVNAPLYMHGQASGSGTTKSIVTPNSNATANVNISQAIGQGMINMIQQKRSVRDVSFKSNNVSTHTEGSERLKENLKMIQKNRLFKGRQGNISSIRDRSTSKEKFVAAGKHIVEQTVEESVQINLQNKD